MENTKDPRAGCTRLLTPDHCSPARGIPCQVQGYGLSSFECSLAPAQTPQKWPTAPEQVAPWAQQSFARRGDIPQSRRDVEGFSSLPRQCHQGSPLQTELTMGLLREIPLWTPPAFKARGCRNHVGPMEDPSSHLLL